jgi:hypothetical protein
VWRGNLARRRIEQHAYIPYTHGSLRLCDHFTTMKRIAHRHKGNFIRSLHVFSPRLTHND